MNELEYFNQVVPVTVATGTGANTISETSATLNESYDDVVGVRVIQLANGGDANYQVGLTNPDKTLHALTHNSDWLFSSSVGFSDRNKAVNAPAQGKQITVQVKNVAALGTDLQLQVIFLLARPKGTC